MKIPAAHLVEVPRHKVVDYLLSETHPVGRHKAVLFRSWGFSADNWQELADSLQRHAADHDITKEEASPFGMRFVVEGINGSARRSAAARASDLVPPPPRDHASLRHRLSIETSQSGKSQMMKELASAVLTVDLPEHGLSAGDIGTIVLLHGREGYEVEFVTLEGEPLAVVSLSADQLRPVEPREIAHARALA